MPANMSLRPQHAHYMGLSGPGLRFAIALISGMSFVAFGYGQGEIGGLMIMETFREKYPSIDAYGHPGDHKTALMAGLVVSSWNLGSFLGAGLTILFGDRVGRKGSAMVGLGMETAGKIVQVSSCGLGQFIAGRVIAGVGNGAIASTIPAWQVETLKTHKRGKLMLVSFGTCIALGLSFSYWTVYGFSFVEPDGMAWRVPVGLSLFLVIPPLIIIAFLPESPRWLMLQAREAEASRVLSAMHELPVDHEDVRREILHIKNAVIYMTSQPLSGLWRNGEYRIVHRTLLAIWLQVMQQFTGINLFFQYLAVMFAGQLQYSPQTSRLLAACCSTEFFFASLIAVVGIDRFWGRRSLTMFGASGMGCSMIALAVLNWAGLEQGTRGAFHAMTVFLFLFTTFFSIGWQGMGWMWAVELVPLSIRGPANALSTAASWLASFLVVFTAPIMFTNITWLTYAVYACLNFTWVPVIYFFYPETGRRTLEEIDILFKTASENGRPWRSVAPIAKVKHRWFDRNGDPTDSYGGGTGAARDPEKVLSSSDDSKSDSPRGCVGGKSSRTPSSQVGLQSMTSRSSMASRPRPSSLERIGRGGQVDRLDAHGNAGYDDVASAPTISRSPSRASRSRRRYYV